MTARTFVVGERLPQTLTREECAGLLLMSLRSFDEHRVKRDHPAIKQLPGPGRPVFDGASVQRWIDQRPADEKRSKFFGSGRKASGF